MGPDQHIALPCYAVVLHRLVEVRRPAHRLLKADRASGGRRSVCKVNLRLLRAVPIEQICADVRKVAYMQRGSSSRLGVLIGPRCGPYLRAAQQCSVGAVQVRLLGGCSNPQALRATLVMSGHVTLYHLPPADLAQHEVKYSRSGERGSRPKHRCLECASVCNVSAEAACLTGHELHMLQLGAASLKTLNGVEKHLPEIHLHVFGLQRTSTLWRMCRKHIDAQHQR